MPKHRLVSDVLYDFGFYDDKGMDWADLLTIINEEWANGKIKILQSKPDLPEPVAWESAQRKIYPQKVPGKRWLKCAVCKDPSRETIREVIFEDPLMLGEDVQHVIERARAAGLVLTEELNDTEIQPSQPNDTVLSTQSEYPSEAAVGAAPKGTIAGEKRCKEWLVELMKDGASPAKSKPKYWKDSQALHNPSRRGFNRAWRAAINETGNTKWGSPGPKSKRSADRKS